ncbi:proton-conducting membrane transporter [Haloprofundus halobius]|uniref:proton-conducting membrane transporter n=1 Tax=Haloprofundus halobius TaxID=2876194 RepID=UPI00295E8A80|nr:proton-conducting membrane transporter [Haloprofundus halobius]
MTTKPQLNDDSNLLPGLAALGLFVLMAVVFLQAEFGTPEGFPADVSIVASIGYAMFDISANQLEEQIVSAEGFLAAFLIMAIALDVAIDGAVYLAKREEAGEVVTALVDDVRSDDPTSGGEPTDGRGPAARADGGTSTDDDTTAGGDR